MGRKIKKSLAQKWEGQAWGDPAEQERREERKEESKKGERGREEETGREG